jgi:hypothetical protein
MNRRELISPPSPPRFRQRIELTSCRLPQQRVERSAGGVRCPPRREPQKQLFFAPELPAFFGAADGGRQEARRWRCARPGLIKLIPIDGRMIMYIRQDSLLSSDPKGREGCTSFIALRAIPSKEGWRLSIDDRRPEDGTDLSSHAAGASSDIPGYNRGGVVVASHAHYVGARADRSE